MKFNSATVSKGMTVNIGNYNSHRVEIGLTVSFDDGEDIDTSIKQLAALVNQKLAHEIKQFTDTKAGKQLLMEDEPKKGN